MEDYVYILDHLVHGRPGHRASSISYGIGEDKFTLLELLPKREASLTVGERVYVGKDKKRRKKIGKVKGRVKYEDLTASAHGELLYIVIDIVKNREREFLKFYNECPPISTRYHVLELLPGLGKKTMLGILEERKKKSFKNFEDMKKRVSTLHHPEKLIARRIEEELVNPNQKYRIFTRPPPRER